VGVWVCDTSYHEKASYHEQTSYQEKAPHHKNTKKHDIILVTGLHMSPVCIPVCSSRAHFNLKRSWVNGLKGSSTKGQRLRVKAFMLAIASAPLYNTILGMLLTLKSGPGVLTAVLAESDVISLTTQQSRSHTLFVHIAHD